MAQKVNIELVDDLDGSPAVETVKFGLDGETFEIDLNQKNADKLRKVVAPYTAGARLTSKAKAGGRRSRNGTTPQQLREWAKGQGMDVSDRGMIPNHVKEAYAAAH